MGELAGELLDLLPGEGVHDHAEDALDDLALADEPAAVGLHADPADLGQFQRDGVAVGALCPADGLVDVAAVDEPAGNAFGLKVAGLRGAGVDGGPVVGGTFQAVVHAGAAGSSAESAEAEGSGVGCSR